MAKVLRLVFDAGFGDDGATAVDTLTDARGQQRIRFHYSGRSGEVCRPPRSSNRRNRKGNSSTSRNRSSSTSRSRSRRRRRRSNSIIVASRHARECPLCQLHCLPRTRYRCLLSAHGGAWRVWRRVVSWWRSRMVGKRRRDADQCWLCWVLLASVRGRGDTELR